jgi:hypothetical protein
VPSGEIDILFGRKPYRLQASATHFQHFSVPARLNPVGNFVNTVLFVQPTVSGINWVCPPSGPNVPKKQYVMNFVQADRFTGDGNPVVSTVDVSALTGFAPVNPATAQRGFQNASGHSVAQMEGGTVGAYLNSNDLAPSASDSKLMITPEYRWILPPWTDFTAPIPLSGPGLVLHEAFDLQVPKCSGGNDVFVNMGHLFTDPNGVQLTYNVAVFHNNLANPGVGISLDAPTQNYILTNPLGVVTTYCTPTAGSSFYTPTPWSGFMHFEWSCSYQQFQAALHALDAAFPGVLTTFDPAQYRLSTTHLNAEVHTLGSAATIELGWSMKNLEIWTVGS